MVILIWMFTFLYVVQCFTDCSSYSSFTPIKFSYSPAIIPPPPPFSVDSIFILAIDLDKVSGNIAIGGRSKFD